MGFEFKFKNMTVITSLMTLLLSLQATHALSADYSAWGYTAPINLDTTGSGANVGSSVSNFPVLIHITDTNKPHADFWGNGTQDAGQDIRFSLSSDNSIALPYQIERWDNSAKLAEIWVLVDTVPGNTASDYITMHWGNPSASSESSGQSVFSTSNGFQGVWHLNESVNNSSNGYKDSTANSNDGTGSSMSLSEIEGPTGLAQTFDGNSDRINVSDHSSLNIRNNLTVSAWVRATNYDRDWNDVLDKREYNLYIEEGRMCALIDTNGGKYDNCPNNSASMSTGNWYHVAFTYSSGNITTYINGAIDGTASEGSTIDDSNGEPLLIGDAAGIDGIYWEGNLGEVRVSSQSRSSSWLKLSYENQKAADSLVSIGTGVAKASASQSSIESSAANVTANGSSTATISVIARDIFGNNKGVGGDTVNLVSTGSAVLSGLNDDNSGTYTATIHSTLAEDVTVSASINGENVGDVTISFLPGPASTATTTITESATNIIANGIAASTITIQLRDAQGNNLSTVGDTLLLAEDGNAVFSSITYLGSGRYSAALTNSVAETVTVSGTINGENISDTASVTFIPGPASTARTTIVASTTSLTADGIASATITVQAKDSQGNNLTVGGDSILLDQDGMASISGINDHLNGTYTATITSTVAETITLSGTLNGAEIADVESLSFAPGPASTTTSTVSTSSGTLTADGLSSTTITFQALDAQGNPLTVGGDTVELTSSGSAIISSVVDSGTGSYTANLTNTVAETVTISARLNGVLVNDTSAVSFTPGSASPLTTEILATPNSVTADGLESAVITLQTKDALGNNLTLGGDTIILAQDGSATLSGLTDAGNGTYSATVTGTVAEIVTISATLNGIDLANSVAISFEPGAPVALSSNLSTSADVITADGVAFSKVTMQARDAQGNDLNAGGADVSFNLTGSATISEVTDLGNGIYEATVTSTLVGLVNISATLNSESVSNDVTIEFVPGTTASASQTTITPSQTNQIADGSSTVSLTIQTKDALGNNLVDGGLSIRLSQNGSATLSSVTDHGDGTYTATITNTLAESITVRGTQNGSIIGDSTVITFIPGSPQATQSTLSSSIDSVTANGTAFSTLTLLTRDNQGNELTRGGATVVFNVTGSANISEVIDQGDGTYIATVTNTVTETVTVSATLNGDNVSNNLSLSFIPSAVASPSNTTLSGSPASQVADGQSEISLLIQARDDFGNELDSGGDTLVLEVDKEATLSDITDNQNGTYTASLTHTIAEAVTITGTINGSEIGNSVTIEFIPGPASVDTSLLSASENVVTANGVSTSELLVELYDVMGNRVLSGGHSLILAQNGNAAISELIDHQDGSFSALISNQAAETVLVTAILNDQLIDSTVSITFVPEGAAQANPSDGQFVNGLAPPGATIEIRNEQGDTLCITQADTTTGAYHCQLSPQAEDGSILELITTDLANTSVTSSLVIDATDRDSDGLTDIMENLLGTDPDQFDLFARPDNDGDQLPDYYEVIFGSDRLDANSPIENGDLDGDLDGLSDAVEYFLSENGGASDSALSSDTDRDGLPDYTELLIEHGNFLNPDSPTDSGSSDDDNDNVSNAAEQYLASIGITNVDSLSDYDRDGYPDALELKLGSQALWANESDLDSDGVNDAVEAFLSGFIHDNLNTATLDRDLDGLFDIYELDLTTSLTDPLALINFSSADDLDLNGLSEAIESFFSSGSSQVEPDSDTDEDGISDVMEIEAGSDPFTPSQPVIWVDHLFENSEEVKLIVNIGGYQSPSPEIFWYTNDSDFLSSDPEVVITDDRTLTIRGLAPGAYRYSISATRHFGDVSLSSDYHSVLYVAEEIMPDSDFDGISDEQDQFAAESGREEQVQSIANDGESYILSSSPSTTLRIGELARMGENQVAHISPAQLDEYLQSSVVETKGSVIPSTNIETIPSLYNVEVVNLPEVGASALFTVPLNQALSESSATLVLNPSIGRWQFFKQDGNSHLHSSAGLAGTCPPPLSDEYNADLSEGDHCVEVSIEDGSENDGDGIRNGRVEVILGFGSVSALPQQETIDPESVDFQVESELSQEATDSDTLQDTSSTSDSSSSSIDSNSSQKSGGSTGLALFLILSVLLLHSFKVQAQPQNGQILSGDATISEVANTLTINQNSNRVAISWDSFDIANGELVEFVQPDSSAMALNIDFSGSPSQVFGSLQANGQVLLLNEAGILIGETASINTGSFLASDLSVDIVDFSDGDFSLFDNAPNSGGITNLGDIQPGSLGSVYLVGQFVDNRGNISSSAADIHLSVADQVIVNTDPSGLIGVQIEKPVLTDISQTGSLIYNDGEIIALDGNIYVDLMYSDQLKANTVNNTGVINAVGIREEAGRVFLTESPVVTQILEEEQLSGVTDDGLSDKTQDSGVTIELETRPDISLDSIMPACDPSETNGGSCQKYNAIKRYLGSLLLGGELPDE